METNNMTTSTTNKTFESHSTTVGELEFRKDKFRAATKEYFERAETEFRCLHGFCHRKRTGREVCNNHRSGEARNFSFQRTKRKRSYTSMSTPDGIETMTASSSFATVNEIRPAAKPVHKPELEQDLARCLLESHFRTVEFAIKEYIASIQRLVAVVIPPMIQGRAPAGNPRQLPPLVVEANLASSLPLQLSPKVSSSPYSLTKVLQRHHSDAIEEQHMAMASVMVAVRETKVTGEFAKKIHNGIDSIQVALRKAFLVVVVAETRQQLYYRSHQPNSFPVAEGTNENSRASPSSRHLPPSQPIPVVRSVSTPQIDSFAQSPLSPIGAETLHQDGSGALDKFWDRTVVQAQKLDGYYRWFRANNGVLLMMSEPKIRRSSGYSSSVMPRAAPECQDRDLISSRKVARRS